MHGVNRLRSVSDYANGYGVVNSLDDLARPYGAESPTKLDELHAFSNHLLCGLDALGGRCDPYHLHLKLVCSLMLNKSISSHDESELVEGHELVLRLCVG